MKKAVLSIIYIEDYYCLRSLMAECADCLGTFQAEWRDEPRVGMYAWKSLIFALIPSSENDAQSFFRSIYQYINPSIYLFICLSIYTTISLSIHLYINPSIYRYICLSIYTTISLYIHLYTNPSIYRYICLSMVI